MAIRERPGPANLDSTLVYGEPLETADGATIITVAHRYGRFSSGVRPVGVFTIRNGEAVWVPAVDVNRIALLGECLGLLSVVIVTLAVFRRPPWPDLSRHRTRRRSRSPE
ncbi:hypothetical protein FEK35_13435 [Nocardia cyriacigeorgica]|uniref:Uncharacterized protein n=1 Tax=Nocardia cyriacigeorgica TaxID=135487 RepID=A0A5R8PEG7_9NOCA|nr:hypothetical protein [Nocardia cyriacigeorgica]TLG10902.1 hypothetical protein FEK35_13435 [Nocardia cyriacigeorgica]